MVILYKCGIEAIGRLDFGQILTCIIVTSTAFAISDACGPVNSLTGLREKLQDLEAALAATNYANFSLEPAVRGADTRGTELDRATVGRPFVFIFRVMSFKISGEFAIRWQHNDLPWTLVNCTLNQWHNDSSGDFALLVEPTRIKFVVQKISPRTLGSYRFSYVDDANRMLHSNKTILRPIYIPQDVFHLPMENVTALVGETVNFRCYVAFNVSETEKTWDRIVWRHGDRVIHSTPKNPMSAYRNLQNAMRNYEFRTQALDSGGRRYRLVVKSASEALAGRYECWFKPDEHYQDWVVQSAFLYVNKR